MGIGRSWRGPEGRKKDTNGVGAKRAAGDRQFETRASEAARGGRRSGSALACRGSGVSVEFGGDQTSPVFLRLAVAKLGLEVQADEGMKNVVGQERHQQECLDGPGVVFVNVVRFPTIDQFIEAEVLDVPSLMTPGDDAHGGRLLGR